MIHPERLIIRIEWVGPVLFLFAASRSSVMVCHEQHMLEHHRTLSAKALPALGWLGLIPQRVTYSEDKFE